MHCLRGKTRLYQSAKNLGFVPKQAWREVNENHFSLAFNHGGKKLPFINQPHVI